MNLQDVLVRPATTSDVPSIWALREPLIEKRVLLGRELVEIYESVQELMVAVSPTGEVLACGALHVMWKDLAEVRSLVVAESARGQRLGSRVVEALIERAKALGIKRVFCLTFETKFFENLGFNVIEDTPVDAETYAEMVRSSDEGIAEFLDLAPVKQNTLGNSRMLKLLSIADLGLDLSHGCQNPSDVSSPSHLCGVDSLEPGWSDLVGNFGDEGRHCKRDNRGSNPSCHQIVYFESR
jgi:amino-acid N-acetyltransferase